MNHEQRRWKENEENWNKTSGHKIFVLFANWESAMNDIHLFSIEKYEIRYYL